MADLVKWLTRRIVAPVCKGSIPLVRPMMLIKVHNVYYELFLLQSWINNECVYRNFRISFVCRNKILRIKDITKLNIEYIKGKNIIFNNSNLGLKGPHKIIIVMIRRSI